MGKQGRNFLQNEKILYGKAIQNLLKSFLSFSPPKERSNEDKNGEATLTGFGQKNIEKHCLHKVDQLVRSAKSDALFVCPTRHQT